jgi:hypothetical protein
MRVSEFFKLGRTQPSLEFVDVDILKDTQVFIDPRAFRFVYSDWSQECACLLQNFFDTVISSIRTGDHVKARRLLSSLSEPNETRLGLSHGKAQGRGMGDALARDVWKSLSRSRAISSGLIEDLEDTVLFVEGIGFDILSDITTNIVRSQLLEFTQDVAGFYGIPLTKGIGSGQLWDRQTRQWSQKYTSLPLTKHGPLLLVPKSIVRRSQTFDPGEYYNHFILPQLQNDEMIAGSSLVEVLKDGRRRVTKESVKKKYGQGKGVNLNVTLKNPAVLERYKQSKLGFRQPLDHADVSDLTGGPLPDWDALLAAVKGVAPGPAGATDYHRSVESLLTALFYPCLDRP